MHVSTSKTVLHLEMKADLRNVMTWIPEIKDQKHLVWERKLWQLTNHLSLQLKQLFRIRKMSHYASYIMILFVSYIKCVYPFGNTWKKVFSFLWIWHHPHMTLCILASCSQFSTSLLNKSNIEIFQKQNFTVHIGT